MRKDLKTIPSYLSVITLAYTGKVKPGFIFFKFLRTFRLGHVNLA